MLRIYYNFLAFFFIITDFHVINLYVKGSRAMITINKEEYNLCMHGLKGKVTEII